MGSRLLKPSLGPTVPAEPRPCQASSPQPRGDPYLLYCPTVCALGPAESVPVSFLAQRVGRGRLSHRGLFRKPSVPAMEAGGVQGSREEGSGWMKAACRDTAPGRPSPGSQQTSDRLRAGGRWPPLKGAGTWRGGRQPPESPGLGSGSSHWGTPALSVDRHPQTQTCVHTPRSPALSTSTPAAGHTRPWTGSDAITLREGQAPWRSGWLSGGAGAAWVSQAARGKRGPLQRGGGEGMQGGDAESGQPSCTGRV